MPVALVAAVGHLRRDPVHPAAGCAAQRALDDTVCVDRADQLPLERHSLRDADAAAADGVLRGSARGRCHVRLPVHAARRGAGSVAAHKARVYVPHASAGGACDAAVGRGRSVRSCRAHRGGALHARHRAAAHLAGHTRARDGRVLRHRRAVRHVHRPRGHAAVPVPARELHRRGLPAARRGRALHVRVRHVGHGGSAGRLALPAGAVHAAHKCRSRRSGAPDQRHGGGGRHCQLLRLDLSARLGGVRAAAARVRGSALPAPPHGERGRHRRHPGAQAGAEVHRGALRRSGNAGRRVRHAAQRAGLPDTSGAVPAADRSWRGARLCHQRDGHPQVPAHPAHGLARLRGHSGRVLPRRDRRKVRPLGLRPPHPGYRAGQKRAHHLQRLQRHAHRGGEHSGRGGHPPRRRGGARKDHGRHQRHQSAADLQALERQGADARIHAPRHEHASGADRAGAQLRRSARHAQHAGAGRDARAPHLRQHRL